MRRALLAVVATVAVVVGLLHYKSSSAPKSLRIAVAGAPQTPSAADAGQTPSQSPAPQASAAVAGPQAAASPAAATGGQTRTITGPVETNQFGPVQVQLTVSGSRITAVKTLQLPTDRARSAYISSVAGPLLIQETLQAQNVNIDNISGASYTSYSFAQSLQAALTQAGLQ